MYIQHLEVTHVRNLLSVQISPHPKTNFIVGVNGSGKTSLLEAICILSKGRSFRTPILKKVVNSQCEDLTVFAEVGDQSGDFHRVGINRHINGTSLVKVDGNRCERLSDLAHLVPTVELTASSFELIDGGPGERRQLMDWGLFHVEHNFIEYWRRYRNALAQKNALLRSGNNIAIRKQVPLWNDQLVETGKLIDNARTQYVEQLVQAVSVVQESYFKGLPVNLSYRPGWNRRLYPSLADCLAQNVDYEIDKGSAQYGPHRADLVIGWQDSLARDICSRGQKKLVLYAVRLAQVILLMKKQAAPLLLLDDLPSELDKQNTEIVTGFLSDHPCQSFITAITQDIVSNGPLSAFREHQMFHVEHGQLTETH